MRAARAAGFRVAPQGTGHGAVALGDLTDTVLLRTTRMQGVSVDPYDRRVRVEAGVEWQAVTDAAAEQGLAALAGSSHDVGVLGGAVQFAEGEYLVYAVGIAPTPEAKVETLREVDGVLRALTPWDSGRDYLNFRESQTSGKRLSEPVLRRLREIKAQVDPEDVFRSNHAVLPAN